MVGCSDDVVGGMVIMVVIMIRGDGGRGCSEIMLCFQK